MFFDELIILDKKKKKNDLIRLLYIVILVGVSITILSRYNI